MGARFDQNRELNRILNFTKILRSTIGPVISVLYGSHRVEVNV